MALSSGLHRFRPHEEGAVEPGPGPAPCWVCLWWRRHRRCPMGGPSLHRPALGPCCAPCWGPAALPPQGPLWGARPSPFACWDPYGVCLGLASPSPWPRAWPRAPARSMESLGSAAASGTHSRPGAGSPPALRGPGEDEALSTAMALCQVSTSSTAIDRSSFIAIGLAAEVLEELLSRQLPAPEQEDGSPEARCCASLTASPSLERLRRHNHSFQRARESFQEPAQAEALACSGQRRCQAQSYSHLCCDPAWHAGHGCCTRVEPVPGTGHQHGPKPGPAAPTRSETSCVRQRHKHRGGSRDPHPALPGTSVSHERQQCRCGSRAVAREPQWEPELSWQPCSQEGLTMSLQCCDGEPEPGPGCGCDLALKIPPPDMGWAQPEPEALVPRSCCRRARAPNMVQVIARSFELRSRQDPRAPPAVPVPAQARWGKAGACNGAQCEAHS